jgi:hypothetical protein
MVSVATKVAGKGGWPVGWGAYLLNINLCFLTLITPTVCLSFKISYESYLSPRKDDAGPKRGVGWTYG